MNVQCNDPTFHERTHKIKGTLSQLFRKGGEKFLHQPQEGKKKKRVQADVQKVVSFAVKAHHSSFRADFLTTTFKILTES